MLAVACLAYGQTENPAKKYAGRKFPSAVEHGKVLTIDGERHLYGGEDPDWHFDIEPFRLDVDKLHHGKGREHFDALMDPKFVPADSADAWLKDDSRVLAVQIGGELKVYPLRLMLRHEALNDVVGGVPVMPVYCVLADLGSVYDRRLGGHTFTFGVSGYTYADEDYWDGLDAFILWDRDTESLWWPLMGKAVSGPMIDAPMKLLDERWWSQTTWGEVKARGAVAVVLEPAQTLDPPEDFPQLGDSEIEQVRSRISSGGKSLSPRWGENTSLECDGDSSSQGSGSK